MDSVFGIGLPELIVILLLAGIVMGPQRIRQAARWLGVITAKLQAISRGFMRQLNSELDAIDDGGDLRGAMQEVQNLRRQVDDLRRELKSSTMGSVNDVKAIAAEGKKALDEANEAIEHSIMPPGLAAAQNDNGRATAADPAQPDVQQSARADVQSDTTPPAKLPGLVEIPDDPE